MKADVLALFPSLRGESIPFDICSVCSDILCFILNIGNLSTLLIFSKNQIFVSFFFLIYLFIYLFLVVLSLHFCGRAFSSCGKWGATPHRRPITVAASLVAEHRLQTRRLSSCGSRAQLLRGMWNPPRPGLEPASPAPAGRLSTTAPPGKPFVSFIFLFFYFKISLISALIFIIPFLVLSLVCFTLLFLYS